MKKPIVLCILDGWGISHDPHCNAVAMSNTPATNRLLAEYPHSKIDASGFAVGLPQGQMGNSEVGHTNLGAGRVVYQELTRISKAIVDGDFDRNPVLLQAMQAGRENALHLFGLVSDGGVHSHIDHVKALVKLAKMQGVKNVYLHAFTDGRDTSPNSGKAFLQNVLDFMKAEGVGEIATVIGRYYAMDRDHRWDRVEKAFRAMVFGEGSPAADAITATEEGYANGENDEFILPRVIVRDGKPIGAIGAGDSVICFNFRPDRAREISRVLADPEFMEFDRAGWKGPLHYATMTRYDSKFPYPVAYMPQSLSQILPEVLAERNLTQFRIAETEKYAHVTYFFNGGRELEFPGEDRALVPSPQDVATYDEKPEMSAFLVTDELEKRVLSGKYDFILVNYANHDMVGHTGNLKAAIAASEAVDQCIARLTAAVFDVGGTLMITADHGNSEQMCDPVTHGPHTAHTTNLVHFILAGEAVKHVKLHDGVLADVAPTVLDLLHLPQPAEMSGKSLIDR